MQGLGDGLCPLWLFGGVVEEESLLAEVKFLETMWKELDSYFSWKFEVFASTLDAVSQLSTGRISGQCAKCVGGHVLLLKTASLAAYICQRCEPYLSVCVCNGITHRMAAWLFSRWVNVTYPTQYMSGGLRVQLSQGRRLSFGACPLTLNVPRKKLKHNEERWGVGTRRTDTDVVWTCAASFNLTFWL